MSGEVFWVSAEFGSDDYDGLTPETAKRTLQAALDATTDHRWRIYVLPGVYYGGNYVFRNGRNSVVQCIGEVVFNCHGHTRFFSATGVGHVHAPPYAVVIGAAITGFSERLGSAERAVGFQFIGCVIYNLGGLYDVALHGTNLGIYGCTLYGIRPQTGNTHAYHNIWLTDFNTSGLRWNRGSNAGTTNIVGLNGIDADEYPPPFRSLDPVNPDFRFNPDHPNLARYVQPWWNTHYSAHIGALWPSTGYVGVEGGQAWMFGGAVGSQTTDGNSGHDICMNDNEFYDERFKIVTIEAGVNDRLPYTDSGGPHVAVLPSGVYNNGGELIDAVNAGLGAVVGGTDTLSASFNEDTQRVIIASDGPSLELNVDTDPLESAWGEIGFTEERTGSSVYAGDEPIVGGRAPTAPVNATATFFSGGGARLNQLINPSGMRARFVSPVIDQGISFPLRRVWASGRKDLPSDGIAATWVRANSTVFNHDDPPGSTEMDWVQTDSLGQIELTVSYRFIQLRCEFGADL